MLSEDAVRMMRTFAISRYGKHASNDILSSIYFGFITAYDIVLEENTNFRPLDTNYENCT